MASAPRGCGKWPSGAGAVTIRAWCEAPLKEEVHDRGALTSEGWSGIERMWLTGIDVELRSRAGCLKGLVHFHAGVRWYEVVRVAVDEQCRGKRRTGMRNGARAGQSGGRRVWPHER